MQIRKAEQQYFIPTNHTFKPAELAVVLHWRDQQTGQPKFTGNNLPQGLAAVTTQAYINHGRWVADCPGPNCSSAQVVSPEDRRFWCITCENVYAGGKWIRVSWPRDWATREQVILERPETRNQNAFPHETTKKLMRENKERLQS